MKCSVTQFNCFLITACWPNVAPVNLRKCFNHGWVSKTFYDVTMKRMIKIYVQLSKLSPIIKLTQFIAGYSK